MTISNEGIEMNTMNTEELLKSARGLIKAAENCFFITATGDGHPHARLMQPYDAEPDFTIYFGASPRSRKVRELEHQSKVSLAFYNQLETSYLILVQEPKQAGYRD